MRKAWLVVAFLLVLAGLAQAESLNVGEELAKLPGLKQGAAYSIKDSQVKYCFTMEAAKWNNVALEVGYIPADEAIAIVTYKLLALKDLGVSIPILDLVEFNAGAYIGLQSLGVDGKNHVDYGLSATVINVKF